MLKPLTRESIGTDFVDSLSVQEYGRKVAIDGVKLLALDLFLDDGGALAEIIRFDEGGCLKLFPDFQARQATYSQVLPGAIKAFHLHCNQEDVWFVLPSDRLLVGLFDARQDSSTYKASMRFVMGAGRAQLLYLPRGVAHGLANPWQQPASMIYFVNQCFNAEKPDEMRLPWDILGQDFWQIKKG
jgi:dTDP-4-dehydrorhamnose 3,5-epimerase